MLLFWQERRNFLVEGFRLRRSHVLGDDAPLPVDQKCDRQSQDSSVSLAGLCISHYHGIIHVELTVEIADRLRSIVHRNADDLQAAVCIFLLQFDKMRGFLAARIAPGCPEIEQYDFPAIGRESEWCAIQLWKHEIGREKMLFRDSCFRVGSTIRADVNAGENRGGENRQHNPLDGRTQNYSPLVVG